MSAFVHKAGEVRYINYSAVEGESFEFKFEFTLYELGSMFGVIEYQPGKIVLNIGVIVRGKI